MKMIAFYIRRVSLSLANFAIVTFIFWFVLFVVVFRHVFCKDIFPNLKMDRFIRKNAE